MMGNSGGRSEKNALGRGATRRATPRERSYIDPPRGAQWEEVELELAELGLSPSNVVLYSAIAVGAFLGLVAVVVTGVWVASLLGIV